MRPYAGIGILFMPVNSTTSGEPIPLYDEPALSRLGELNGATIPSFDVVFGTSSSLQPLVVMARKGEWLRVSYDDAGREAWLKPPRHAVFQSWDAFLKRNISQMLPGLQKKYYQAFQQPGASQAATLTTRQLFKVLRLEEDWAMVLIEQNLLGWVRWRDEDGKILIGVATEPAVRQP
jgi:hypothetical protein